jgi:hypothetical protein
MVHRAHTVPSEVDYQAAMRKGVEHKKEFAAWLIQEDRNVVEIPGRRLLLLLVTPGALFCCIAGPMLADHASGSSINSWIRWTSWRFSFLMSWAVEQGLSRYSYGLESLTEVSGQDQRRLLRG